MSFGSIGVRCAVLIPTEPSDRLVRNIWIALSISKRDPAWNTAGDVSNFQCKTGLLIASSYQALTVCTYFGADQSGYSIWPICRDYLLQLVKMFQLAGMYFYFTSLRYCALSKTLSWIILELGGRSGMRLGFPVHSVSTQATTTLHTRESCDQWLMLQFSWWT